MKLPGIFYSCDNCGSSPTACDSECQCDVTNHEKYGTLEYVTRGDIYVIPPGATQAAKLGPVDGVVRGFAFWDDHEDAGFIVEDEPKLTLPFLNEDDDEFTEDAEGWKFILAGIADGDNPTPWKQVGAPTEGIWLVTVEDGLFKFTAGEELPGLTTIFADSEGALVIEIVGFYDTEQDAEFPNFVSRKLIGYDGLTRPVVIAENEDTGRWEIKALAEEALLFHPAIGFETVGQINPETGEIIDGGFDTRPNEDLSDYALVFYNQTTKKLYKAPLHTHFFHQETSDLSLTEDGNWNSTSPHAEANVTLNYPTVKVTVYLLVDGPGGGDVRFDGLRLKANGVVVHTWRNVQDENAGTRDHFMTVTLTDMELGATDFVVEYKESNSPSPSDATKIVMSTISVDTMF